MQNGEKFGASAVRKLVRMNMRVFINPFPEVKVIISKAHKF